jgi:hypothetical protein
MTHDFFDFGFWRKIEQLCLLSGNCPKMRLRFSPGQPRSWSATSIVVSVPNGATSGNVVVKVGSESRMSSVNTTGRS